MTEWLPSTETLRHVLNVCVFFFKVAVVVWVLIRLEMIAEAVEKLERKNR